MRLSGFTFLCFEQSGGDGVQLALNRSLGPEFDSSSARSSNVTAVMESPARRSHSVAIPAMCTATVKETSARQKTKKAGELVTVDTDSANRSNLPRPTPPRSAGC